jgi:hypothetical protein
MNQDPDIVFSSTIGQLICQVKRSGNGYVRQQIFPTGQVFEEDYTEEEYQDFLKRMEAFNSLASNPLNKRQWGTKGKK